jgi:aspartyl-tRNA synthetase
MREAVEILKSRGYTLPADKKGDIDPGGEREIAAYVKEKFNHDFVFLTDCRLLCVPSIICALRMTPL